MDNAAEEASSDRELSAVASAVAAPLVSVMVCFNDDVRFARCHGCDATMDFATLFAKLRDPTGIFAGMFRDVKSIFDCNMYYLASSESAAEAAATAQRGSLVKGGRPLIAFAQPEEADGTGAGAGASLPASASINAGAIREVYIRVTTPQRRAGA